MAREETMKKLRSVKGIVTENGENVVGKFACIIVANENDYVFRPHEIKDFISSVEAGMEESWLEHFHHWADKSSLQFDIMMAVSYNLMEIDNPERLYEILEKSIVADIAKACKKDQL